MVNRFKVEEESSASRRVNVRIPVEDYRFVVALAGEKRMTVSAVVVECVRKARKWGVGCR